MPQINSESKVIDTKDTFLQMDISEKCYSKLVMHTTKYQTGFGLILGRNDQLLDYVPLGHTLQVNPLLEDAIGMVEKYCKQNNLFILGVYNNPLLVFGKYQLFWNDKLEHHLSLDILQDGKQLPVQYLRFEERVKEAAKECLVQKRYQSLYDFENHLSNVSLDWLTQ
ncbi:hypothetical protein EDD86DRAFT_219310 [Gorgonomyces haynaldii]|nr:hypothetical protein EDD86DRAFT_219310 [Gorgonomyces haynaldii]